MGVGWKGWKWVGVREEKGTDKKGLPIVRYFQELIFF